MKLSTKGRYGLRSLIDLAIYSTKTHQSLASIAERQKISEIYLEQVFATLRKANIVKSIKGAQGGYLLGDLAENIKISTVLKVLEGDMSVMDQDIENETDQKSIAYCIKVNIWDKIDYQVNLLLDSLTLEDLVDEYKKLNYVETTTYYI